MIKVLIVDDEKDVCDTCVMYLRNNGYDAVGAGNSKDAFELIDDFAPDVIVLDINLREQYSGIDVLRTARQKHPGIKSIMLTGLEKCEDTKDAVEYGANIIIKKPVAINSIKEAIEELAEE
jgi:two-component system OmpR family response regulator